MRMEDSERTIEETLGSLNVETLCTVTSVVEHAHFKGSTTAWSNWRGRCITIVGPWGRDICNFQVKLAKLFGGLIEVSAVGGIDGETVGTGVRDLVGEGIGGHSEK